MVIHCGKCDQILKEGEEVRGRFHAYYHALRSKVSFSVTSPHNVEADSLEHLDCLDTEP